MTPRKRIAFAVVLALGASAPIAATVQAQQTRAAAAEAALKASPVSVVWMYSHSDGTAHIERQPLPPQLLPAESISYQVAMPGVPMPAINRDWHGAPYPRYIITLSGSSEMEVSGGAERKFIADTNHVLLADDVTGKGHRSIARPIGDKPWVTAYVKLDMSKIKRDAAGRLVLAGG